MKKLLLVSIALIASAGLFAQIICNEKSISGSTPEIKTALGNEKELVYLYSITLPYPAKEVKNALHARLEKEGIKGSKGKNNFYAFKGVNYSYLWDNKCDIYVSITGKTEASAVNLIISQGYDNYINPNEDSITTEKAFKWLINVDKVVYDHIYQQTLAAHLKEESNINKELKKLESQLDKIESKIKKNEEKQLKLEASKTIVNAEDLNVDSKQIAKEQKEALKLQQEAIQLKNEQALLEQKIKNTKDDLKTKKQAITEYKSNKISL